MTAYTTPSFLVADPRTSCSGFGGDPVLPPPIADGAPGGRADYASCPDAPRYRVAAELGASCAGRMVCNDGDSPINLDRMTEAVEARTHLITDGELWTSGPPPARRLDEDS